MDLELFHYIRVQCFSDDLFMSLFQHHLLNNNIWDISNAFLCFVPCRAMGITSCQAILGSWCTTSFLPDALPWISLLSVYIFIFGTTVFSSILVFDMQLIVAIRSHFADPRMLQLFNAASHVDIGTYSLRPSVAVSNDGRGGVFMAASEFHNGGTMSGCERVHLFLLIIID